MVILVSGTKRHDYFIWKTVVWHTVTGKMLSGTKQLQSTEPLSGRICLEQNILSFKRVALCSHMQCCSPHVVLSIYIGSPLEHIIHYYMVSVFSSQMECCFPMVVLEKDVTF